MNVPATFLSVGMHQVRDEFIITANVYKALQECYLRNKTPGGVLLYDINQQWCGAMKQDG